MQSVSPVFSKNEVEWERVIAREQKEYIPLIGLPMDIEATDKATGEIKMIRYAAVAVRWRLSDDERAKIMGGADIVVTEMVFGQPFTPLNFQFCQPDERPEF
jgi:hypothetical protein